MNTSGYNVYPGYYIPVSGVNAALESSMKIGTLAVKGRELRRDVGGHPAQSLISLPN